MENLVSLQALKSFYQNKKVFITGHTGFKGPWLASCLHLLGARLKGYALPPEYQNGLFDLMNPLGIIETVFGDIRDKKLLQKEIESFEPDYIFHLAAQPLVRRSYEIPAETFDVNVVGTANLLEVVRDLSKKCTVVIITTDKVYENKEQNILYQEDDMLGGYDPYSTSKACTELVVTSFRRSFFQPLNYRNHQKALATVRAGNVIGGGDWSKDRIIPDIVRSLVNSKVIDVRNPFAIRPWQHVLEPIGGYLVLAAKMDQQPMEFSKAYNFGPLPDDHLTVQQLVETSIKRWGGGQWKDTSDPNQPHEASLLKLDITRAISELNWKPKLDATKAIDWTIQWYKQPKEKQVDFSYRQIKDYFEL